MSKLKKYLKSKECKKLAKSIAKEWEKSGLLSEAALSSVAGGVDWWKELPIKLLENIPFNSLTALLPRLLRGMNRLAEDVQRAPERFNGELLGGRPINYFDYFL